MLMGMRYHFADCELDAEAHVLRRQGQTVHVEPQVFDLLMLLASSGGNLVSYDALIDAVWQGRIVSNATLTARISSARLAVGDDGKRQDVIHTVQRRGIQMAVPVVQTSNEESAIADVKVPEALVAKDGPPQSIRYVRSRDNVNIAYAMTGQGPPLVRVGHWLTHLDLEWYSPIWRPLLERLGQNFSVFRYDQRGTGLSDREFGGKSIDEFVDDLEAIVEATGAEKVPIFTASQGVAVALKFAARHPDRISRMVLYAGYAQGRYHRGTEEAKQEAKAHLALVRSGWGQPRSPFLKLFTQLYMPSGTPEQIEHLIQLQLASASPEGAAKLRDILDDFDVSDILARVDAPVLLIHGHGDAVQPFEQSQMMARHLKNATLVPLDTDSHVPLPHTPAWEVLMAETERFLCRGA